MTHAPKAYGYVRLRPDAGERELLHIDRLLRHCADRHALRIVGILYEEGPGLSPDRLIRRLGRDGIRHVVVPSLRQITEHPPLRRHLARAIILGAGARLYEADPLAGAGHFTTGA
ncbi:hypothetical protein ACIQPQ_00665 [Streptomyces sp. NPDC091281]|uniref:hypothetical protein n=1 Tax=Streptomyces sp. NPDC091281 TaxID=3365985 RepID=UPI003801C11A